MEWCVIAVEIGSLYDPSVALLEAVGRQIDSVL